MNILSVEDASEVLSSAYSRIFRPRATLPAQVFHTGFNDYRWMEFEFVLDDEFWDVVKRCALEADVSNLYVASTDADNEINFGHSGVARFARYETGDDYTRFMELGLPESPALNLANVGDQLLFFDESYSWGFVANRSVEVAVGARSGLHEWPSARVLSYLSFDSMLGIASGPYHKNLPPTIRAQYVENYRM